MAIRISAFLSSESESAMRALAEKYALQNPIHHNSRTGRWSLSRELDREGHDSEGAGLEEIVDWLASMHPDFEDLGITARVGYLVECREKDLMYFSPRAIQSLAAMPCNVFFDVYVDDE